jgi:hypothetical protein
VGRRVVWGLLIVGVLVAGAGAWVTLRAREEVPDPRKPAIPTWVGKKPAPLAPRVRAQQARAGLFAELQPVKLANCEFARYGEGNDGGYLACRNLPHRRSGPRYSLRISGYDGWGCAVSTELRIPRPSITTASDHAPTPSMPGRRNGVPSRGHRRARTCTDPGWARLRTRCRAPPPPPPVRLERNGRCRPKHLSS